MVYQAVRAVGLTFLQRISLVKPCSGSKLSAFTFITPLFGAFASYFIMHDTLTPVFGAAALLVIAGLYPVNRPTPSGHRFIAERHKNLIFEAP
jgi:drug/metabolite transporter (DMT)-like permease